MIGRDDVEGAGQLDLGPVAQVQGVAVAGVVAEHRVGHHRLTADLRQAAVGRGSVRDDLVAVLGLDLRVGLGDPGVRVVGREVRRDPGHVLEVDVPQEHPAEVEAHEEQQQDHREHERELDE